MTLDELLSTVQVGWKVKITNHQYGSEGRDDCTVVDLLESGWTIKPRRPWMSQGRYYRTLNLSLEGGDDFEIDGLKLTTFYTPTAITSRTTPGVRQPVKTYTFEKPR